MPASTNPRTSVQTASQNKMAPASSPQLSQIRFTGTPEWMQAIVDFHAIYGDMWQDPNGWIGKPLAIILGGCEAFLASLPFIGARAGYNSVKGKREAKGFISDVEELKSSNATQYIEQMEMAVNHPNWRIRQYGIANINTLNASLAVKASLFLTALEDPDIDLYRFTKERLQDYLLQADRDDRLTVLLSALLNAAPTIQSRRTTTMMPVGKVMVPVTSTYYYRTAYTSQYNQVKAEVQQHIGKSR